MSFPVRVVAVLSTVSVVLLMASGCALSTVSESAGSAAKLPSISGRLHGGQQPVSGASIQLYAANVTTLQGVSTAMLTQPVTSASDGTFSITGDYTCPSSNPLVYIVATGGNPGLPGNSSNSGIAMMSLLGSCNTLTASPSTTFIFIDELTTVVSVQVLAPFMTDYAHVGSSPTGISGVGGAFDTGTSEINFSTGQFGNGTTANLSLPELTISTVADIISACINTASGSSPCNSLFSNTGGSTDTIAAALQIVKSPGQNTSQLYGLITPNPPFQPYFTTVPTDFSSTVGFSFPSFIQGGTLDSNGHLWLYFGGYNYDTASDTSTDSAGYIAVYDNNFNQLFTINPGTGGLYYPSDFGRDASGHVFAINSNNSISEFDTNGAPLSPATGWATGLPTTFSPTGPGNGYISNSSQGGPIVIDSLGNIWGGTPYNATPGNCYFELNSSGTIITPTGTFCTVTGIGSVNQGAVDGLGNAWALGTSSIAKANAQGNLASTAATSQGCLYPESNIFTSGNISLAYESVTTDILFDHVHNQLWGYSETGAGAVTNSGAAVFCDYGSTALPVLQQYSSTATTPGSPFTAGSLLIDSATLDGAGNLWFVTGGVTATGVVGSTAGTFTGTASYSAYLGEISSSGALMTPYNASTQTYGLQPTGFGPNVTASATTAFVSPYAASVGLLGVDRFGNIWAIDEVSNRILKITGLAAANTVNY